MVPSQVKGRIAKHATRFAFRRDEVCGAGGIQNIFICRIRAFAVIGVQQRLRRQATHYQIQLPHQTVCVLQARVGAPRAKRRDLVCSITNKQQTLMTKLFHATALEGVNTDPLQLKFCVVAKHSFETWQYFFRFALFFGVCIPAQLKVNAPNVIGLLV